MKQSQADKLYAGLKDLAGERRAKLDEALRLFQLSREVDDLEQWITERELVASSQELGQDYDHVTVSALLFIYEYKSRQDLELVVCQIGRGNATFPLSQELGDLQQ